MNDLYSHRQIKLLRRGPLIALCLPIFLLLALCLLISIFLPKPRHDRDEELLGVFRKHKPTFDLLIVMVGQDHTLVRVDSDWTAPAPPPISTAGLSEDRRLVEDIGCPAGFEHDGSPKSGITFIAAYSGFVSGGWTKGYYYSDIPPKPLDENLDGYPTSHDGPYDYVVCRHIEGNWYLYFSYES